jgi:serine/threonine protein kinase
MVNDSASGAMRSRSGFVFPPCIVTERGVTARDWTGLRHRTYFDVASMVERLAQLLHTLHASGRVHRDLKPDNVLYLLQSTQWRLIDLGIAASSGALAIIVSMRASSCANHCANDGAAALAADQHASSPARSVPCGSFTCCAS